MKYLLGRGAHLNPDPVYSEKPVHAAARSGALDAVRFLVDYGADVNWTDSRNLNALNSAAIWGQTAVVLYLIQKGANVNLIDNRCGKPHCRSSVHQAGFARAYDAFVALVKAGADVNQQDERGMSALHWAVYSFNPNIVKLVTAHGANVTLNNQDGRTARELARYLLSPEEFDRIRARELTQIIKLLDDART